MEHMDLNERIMVNDKYKIYEGPYGRGSRAILPELKALFKDGREIISMKEVMEQRLGAPESTRNMWRDGAFLTNMCFIPRADRSAMKCVLGHPAASGNFSVPENLDDLYDAVKEGFEIDTKECYASEHEYKKIVNGVNLYREGSGPFIPDDREARIDINPDSSYSIAPGGNRWNEFWEFAAEGDKKLLKEYHKLVNTNICAHFLPIRLSPPIRTPTHWLDNYRSGQIEELSFMKIEGIYCREDNSSGHSMVANTYAEYYKLYDGKGLAVVGVLPDKDVTFSTRLRRWMQK